MHKALLTMLILACASLSLAAPARDKSPTAGKAKEEAKDTDKGGKDDEIKLPPFPADKSVTQSMLLAGRVLKYTATVGSLPVRDEKGKKIAEVVFTAYTLDGPKDPNRPVTFAFNGGPGAASVYLNLGAIGPKRVQFGAQGDTPSDPGQAAGQPGHLARLHRPRVHRPGRHRLLPLAGLDGRDQEALLGDQARHRVPVADRLRLAGRRTAAWPRPSTSSARATAASAARASPTTCRPSSASA